MSINNEKILLPNTKYLEHKAYWNSILENYNNENYFKSYKEHHTKTFNMVNKKFKVDTKIVNKLMNNSKNNDM